MSFGSDLAGAIASSLGEPLFHGLLLMFLVVAFVIGWQLGDAYDIVAVGQ